MNLNTARAKFIAATFIYGTMGIIVSLMSVPNIIIVLFRGIIGAGLILMILKIKKSRLSVAAIKANLKWLLISGLCLGMNWVCLYSAYNLTSVAVATLCDYTAPLIMVALSPFLFHEKIIPRKAVCLGVAFVGVIFISGVLDGGGNMPNNGLGVLLGMGSALFFAGLIYCNKKISEDVPVYDKVVIQLAMSSVAVLPFALFTFSTQKVVFSALDILLILMLGIVHTGIAYYLYFGALGVLPVQTIALLGYIEPIVSIAGSILILRQNLTPLGAVGACLILGSLFFSDRIRKPSAQEPPQDPS
ncbi:MAG: EamA family transporter [Eubacterium sp.]|nr:EamA family transporter [Eubacterium sp.]